MNSTHYRLKTPTLAILTSEDKKIPVTIPHGSTVELIDDDVIGNRLVQARWDGKIVTMFTVDLQTRGELVMPEGAGG